MFFVGASPLWVTASRKMPSGLEFPLGTGREKGGRPRPAVDRGIFYITINPISLLLAV